jgi:hypothetical protein
MQWVVFFIFSQTCSWYRREACRYTKVLTTPLTHIRLLLLLSSHINYVNLSHYISVEFSKTFNMDMDMPSPSLVGIPLPSMNAMSGMSSTFSSSTRVTLWFTTWTTTTSTTYFLTIVFLVSLGILNRFLGALKSQLERKWYHQDKLSSDALYVTNVENKASSNGIHSHTRQWSRTLRPQAVRLGEPEEQEAEPLSPASHSQHSGDGKGAKRMARSRRFWIASAPWSIKKDGVSAALEFIKTFIGYILYGFMLLKMPPG